MTENICQKFLVTSQPFELKESSIPYSPKLPKLTAPLFERIDAVLSIPKSSISLEESTESLNPKSICYKDYLAIEESLDEILSKLQDALKKCEIMGIGKSSLDYMISGPEYPSCVQEKVFLISSMIDSVSSQLTRIIKYTQYSTKFHETRTSTPFQTPSSYGQFKTPLTVNSPFSLDDLLETDVTVSSNQFKKASNDSDLLSKIFETRNEMIVLNIEEKKSLGALIIGCVRDSSSQEYQRMYQEAMNKYIISENLLIKFKKLLLQRDQEIEVLEEELIRYKDVEQIVA